MHVFASCSYYFTCITLALYNVVAVFVAPGNSSVPFDAIAMRAGLCCWSAKCEASTNDTATVNCGNTTLTKNAEVYTMQAQWHRHRLMANVVSQQESGAWHN